MSLTGAVGLDESAERDLSDFQVSSARASFQILRHESQAGGWIDFETAESERQINCLSL
jgi:hypothetical protein